MTVSCVCPPFWHSVNVAGLGTVSHLPQSVLACIIHMDVTGITPLQNKLSLLFAS